MNTEVRQESDPHTLVTAPPGCRKSEICCWAAGVARGSPCGSCWLPVVAVTGGVLVSGAEIAELNIPTGIPLLYELDDSFAPKTPGGRYLDPEAAKTAAEAVKNQGR